MVDSIRRRLPDPVRIPLYRAKKRVHRVKTRVYDSMQWVADPILRASRQRLVRLQGAYKGNRCFIMGNGPSLNDTPLEMLRSDLVWGMNRCYLLFDRISWRPAFYTAVDTRVVPDSAADINQLVRDLPAALFFFPMHFRLAGLLRSAPNTYWYRQVDWDLEDLPDGHFSVRVPAYVRVVPTVTLAALQIAVHLGFSPIYLIGCDTSYTVPVTSHFDDARQERIVATRDDDPNHFDPSYFGTGSKYHQPHPERMLFGYVQAKQVCDRMGVQVLNATVGGKLEVFPRVDFNHLF